MNYAVKCPRCSKKAEAQMTAVGIKGTYREPTAKLKATKITCGECGHVTDSSDAPTGEYELWFSSTLRGHRLWAVNESQRKWLIQWLSGNLDNSRLSLTDRSYVEALPKWVLMHRQDAVECLQKMRTDR